MRYRITKDFPFGSEEIHKHYRKNQEVDDSEFSAEIIEQKLIPLGWIEPISDEVT
jgi:hypothetical protein